ncbi:glycosyltransferase family 61 protein [Nocardioides sp. Root140]|uniref:glycosyltransferase family 61 protein n=1 Tax=Nocardioides sp. Root140 TaxID=1736460 RepID=UPI0006FBC7D7|nr:glycosyltransferase family 61 protein [Nocardioides sp. Root140]KQY50150.1 hypothetical protein ASD30_21725 [Nocardioides sp. Root140]
MSRLPNWLEPAFPVVKRAHRFATRRVGALTRRQFVPTRRQFVARAETGDRSPETDDRSIGTGDRSMRAVPWTGTESVDETCRLDPAAVVQPLAPARPAPRLEPTGHWFWRGLGSYDEPRRFLLTIENGLVVGDYAAHVTPRGVLDYETSEYYGVNGWQEHPIYLRRRMPPVTPVDGSLLSLATRGTGGNYYHFVMDLLPRWGVHQEARPGDLPDHFLLSRGSRYQEQLLGMLGLDAVSTLQPAKHLALRPDTLLVPSMSNPDTMAPPWTTRWLSTNLPPSAAASTLPDRIYITRGSARNTRRLVNEDEIFAVLERQGFVKIDCGALSVQEQIDHFAAASVIVAPHGAALTNLNFCSPGVRVLELFAPRYLNKCFWAIASNIPESTYAFLVGTSARPVREGNPMGGVQDDITIPVADFTAALESLLATAPASPATPSPGTSFPGALLGRS